MRYSSFFRELVKKRRPHKGQNGRVLIIGGSEKYVGAVALAGLAALRAGADLVTIAAPEKIAWAINTLSPDLITHKLRGKDFTLKHLPELLRLASKADVVLLGNSMSPKTFPVIHELVQKVEKPLVLDAAALRTLRLEEIHNAILTPHWDELRSLLINSGQENLFKLIFPKHENLPKQFLNMLQKVASDNVILFKGHIDYIISKAKTDANKTGNAGMSKGGTGDVLAGLCAGFVAQTGELWESAGAAAYINGLAGDMLLQKKKGYTFLASDLIEEIGRLLKKIRA